MRQSFTILIVLTGSLAALARGGPGDPKKASNPESELAQAPAAARSWKNPYEGRPEVVQAGKLIFERRCAQCHGADAKGIGRAPNLHEPPVKGAAPGTLFWFLRNGNLKQGMPSFSSLTDQQRWQLVSFLLTLR